jgi:hypothetical protein
MANTFCRSSFCGARCGRAAYRLSARGRARADAQGRCDGAGSGEIGLRKPSGALILCRRVFAFCLLCHISLVRSRSGGLGYSNAKTARLILPGAQTSAFCRAAVRMPLSTRRPSHRGVRTAANNLTNQQGIIVRTSGAKIVTRYTSISSTVSTSWPR